MSMIYMAGRPRTHIDIDDGIYIEIAWDSISLDLMPAEYIETSLEEGFEYYLMWLSENEVVPVEPRDQPKAVDEKIITLNEQFHPVLPLSQAGSLRFLTDSFSLE